MKVFYEVRCEAELHNRVLRVQDPSETAIEAALCPGQFINYNASWSFVDSLRDPASAIESLVRTDPRRASRLYETFLAGCYEKAEELDDSSGSFWMFVDDLYAGWINARQTADANPEETAAWLLAQMEGIRTASPTTSSAMR